VVYDEILIEIRQVARRLSDEFTSLTDREAQAIYAAAAAIESLRTELEAVRKERDLWEREFRNG